eukprot:gene9626-7539_t
MLLSFCVIMLLHAARAEYVPQASLQMRAVPWLLPEGHPKLSHEGQHNDLLKLLKRTQENNWVTVFTCNKAVWRYLLNAIYSFVRFGQ